MVFGVPPGADGFIVVDLPPEASQDFRKHCQEFQM
jgi:tryptophan synthase alpha subunit